MTEPTGAHRSEYPADAASVLLAEAAELLRAFGFAAEHLVLIGGIVPGLLVPDLDPGVEPHIGTGDLDLCMSVAFTEGETTEYERLETVLRRNHFEPKDSFRWVRRQGVRLTVEFFCAASAERPAGRVFRPRATEAPTAKHNLGGQLSALALEAGEILTIDRELVTRTLHLPLSGVADVTIPVTGPVAFLVAKTDALEHRDKPKDAYDLVWILDSWPDGPGGAARAMTPRRAFGRSETTRALQRLASLFETPEHLGPTAYGRFCAEPGDAEDRAEQALNAHGAVWEFLDTIQNIAR